jgi:hypothetical protein
MKKSKEKECIKATYELPNCKGISLLESESPDYLYQLRDKTLFGIEVTEIYANQGAARIENIPGYTDELLSKKAYRHKQDHKYLPIEKVRFHPEGRADIEAEALVQMLPPFAERAALLTEAIASKERKYESYQQRASVVDLIVYDPTGLFSFSDFGKFFPALASIIGRVAVANSSFREVFLLTKANSGRVIRIPLKLNLIAAEIVAFERLIQRSRFITNSLTRRRKFLYLIAALELAGFGSIRASVEKCILCLRWGSWLLRYEPTGKKIRDASFRRKATLRGEPLKRAISFGEFSRNEKRFIRRLLKRKKRLVTCVPLAFPCQTKLSQE